MFLLAKRLFLGCCISGGLEWFRCRVLPCGETCGEREITKRITYLLWVRALDILTVGENFITGSNGCGAIVKSANESNDRGSKCGIGRILDTKKAA